MLLTAPVTVNLTVIPARGLPTASRTVAVTQCWVPTGFVAAAGGSVRVAGFAAAAIFTTTASMAPLNVSSNAPGVVGKSTDVVYPATYAFPAASTAMR